MLPVQRRVEIWNRKREREREREREEKKGKNHVVDPRGWGRSNMKCLRKSLFIFFVSATNSRPFEPWGAIHQSCLVTHILPGGAREKNLHRWLRPIGCLLFLPNNPGPWLLPISLYFTKHGAQLARSLPVFEFDPSPASSPKADASPKPMPAQIRCFADAAGVSAYDTSKRFSFIVAGVSAYDTKQTF